MSNVKTGFRVRLRAYRRSEVEYGRYSNKGSSSGDEETGE